MISIHISAIVSFHVPNLRFSFVEWGRFDLAQWLIATDAADKVASMMHFRQCHPSSFTYYTARALRRLKMAREREHKQKKKATIKKQNRCLFHLNRIKQWLPIKKCSKATIQPWTATNKWEIMKETNNSSHIEAHCRANEQRLTAAT